MARSLIGVLVVGSFFACGGPLDEPLTQPGDESASTSPLTIPAAAQQQILDLVNYPGTDLTTLNGSAGVEAAAARNIVATRNGADGVTPSSDDVVFETIARLDAVPQVGTAALLKLQTYAAAHPAPAGVTVKGVVFHGWEAESVVWGVNQVTSADLNAQIDDRAAASLISHRPFTSISQMATLSYVGASALNQLLGGAMKWWSLKHGVASNLAGRFDGAVFNQTEAETALQIVNQATLAQLTAHGVTATSAGLLIAARPFASLTQVASLRGIGSATMNALLAYAQSGQWGQSCVSEFSAAVSPQLPSLLFMSESDRPIDLVQFPGAGATAPTGAALMALVHSAAGSTVEVRDPANYYIDFEPADSPAGSLVQAAISAQLTDVVYFAIHPPAGSVDQALVDVYLVGRTRCGDLVGLHAISVET